MLGTTGGTGAHQPQPKHKARCSIHAVHDWPQCVFIQHGHTVQQRVQRAAAKANETTDASVVNTKMACSWPYPSFTPSSSVQYASAAVKLSAGGEWRLVNRHPVSYPLASLDRESCALWAVMFRTIRAGNTPQGLVSAMNVVDGPPNDVRSSLEPAVRIDAGAFHMVSAQTTYSSTRERVATMGTRVAPADCSDCVYVCSSIASAPSRSSSLRRSMTVAVALPSVLPAFQESATTFESCLGDSAAQDSVVFGAVPSA